MSAAPLRARNLEKHLAWAQMMIPVVADRLAGDDAELRAELVVQTSLACFDIALSRWAKESERRTPSALLALAFATVAPLRVEAREARRRSAKERTRRNSSDGIVSPVGPEATVTLGIVTYFDALMPAELGVDALARCGVSCRGHRGSWDQTQVRASRTTPLTRSRSPAPDIPSSRLPVGTKNAEVRRRSAH